MSTARYDDVVDLYTSTPETWGGNVTVALFELAGSVERLRILDLACGHGRITRELRRRGASVLCVSGGWFVFSILHPCFPGAAKVSGSWQRSYYDEGFWRADGELSVLRQRVGANHRMLSTYLNALGDRGLLLDRLLEPPPDDEWLAERAGARACPSTWSCEPAKPDWAGRGAVHELAS